MDSGTSHNNITMIRRDDIPIIIHSFGVNSSPIFDKPFEDNRGKVTIGISESQVRNN